MKEEKQALQKSNIEHTQVKDDAVKDYSEVKDVILKLDEARYVMNRLMGPSGALSEEQRNKYLSGNVGEHDRLAAQVKPIGYRGNDYKAAKASGATNPVRSGSGLQMLRNNASK